MLAVRCAGYLVCLLCFTLIGGVVNVVYSLSGVQALCCVTVLWCVVCSAHWITSYFYLVSCSMCWLFIAVPVYSFGCFKSCVLIVLLLCCAGSVVVVVYFAGCLISWILRQKLQSEINKSDSVPLKIMFSRVWYYSRPPVKIIKYDHRSSVEFQESTFKVLESHLSII